MKKQHLNPLDAKSNYDFSDHKISYAVAHCRGKGVLDLGCASHSPSKFEDTHWLHGALNEVSGSLLGMDYSSEGVGFLAERGFTVVHGDEQNFTLDRQFDVIVAGDLIEHLENQAGFFESCKRHLKPGGKIIVSTPNPWFWKYLVLAMIHREVPNNPEHTCWFCPRTYRQLCDRFDLELTDIEFGSRYLRDRIMPLPRGWKHTSWHGTLVLKDRAN